MSVTTKRKRGAARRRADEACKIIERGPNWLFLRLEPAAGAADLADRLWSVARQHFTTRLLIEFDPEETVSAEVGAELRALSRRLHEIGGELRLCGLPAASADSVLSSAGCDGLAHESSRRDAVVGDSVNVLPKPR